MDLTIIPVMAARKPTKILEQKCQEIRNLRTFSASAWDYDILSWRRPSPNFFFLVAKILEDLGNCAQDTCSQFGHQMGIDQCFQAFAGFLSRDLPLVLWCWRWCCETFFYSFLIIYVVCFPPFSCRNCWLFQRIVCSFSCMWKKYCTLVIASRPCKRHQRDTATIRLFALYEQSNRRRSFAVFSLSKHKISIAIELT